MKNTRLSLSSLVTALVAMALSPACSDDASSSSETRALAQAISSSLHPVTGFGTNPGGLNLYEYVPANLPAKAPLVLVLHGCTQGASDIQNLGWNELADQYGFVVGYPEQTTANNQMRCFDWGGVYGDMTTLKRNQGENASIKQMADALVASHGLDSKRVYIAGFSAGAGMAVVVGAVWPDVFAGVASYAGIPYACPASYSDVFTCQNPGVDKTDAEWGDKVRAAFPGYSGQYPRVSVWQGASDTTVGTKNRASIVKQWTNVHGLATTPSVSGTVDGATYTAFKDASGQTLVESYEVPGMPHGVAVAPSKGCGSTGQYAFDKGICASARVAQFFGLMPMTEPVPDGDGGLTLAPNGDAGVAADGGKDAASASSGPSGAGSSAGGKGANGANAASGYEDTRSPGSTCSAAPGRARSSEPAALLSLVAIAALLSRARARSRARSVADDRRVMGSAS